MKYHEVPMGLTYSILQELLFSLVPTTSAFFTEELRFRGEEHPTNIPRSGVGACGEQAIAFLIHSDYKFLSLWQWL